MLQRAGKNRTLETAQVENMGSAPPQGSTEREKQPPLESTAGGQCPRLPLEQDNEDIGEEPEHIPVCP